MQDEGLDIDIRTTGAITRATVRGDVDMASGDQLRNALLTAGGPAEGSTDLVIDLEQVSFMDSFGLHVLVDVVEQRTGRGEAVRIVALSPQVRRLLEITGLTEVLPLDDLAG